MRVLLVAEHDNRTLKPASLNALTAAKAIGGELVVLVAGQNCRPAAEASAAVPGVSKVLLADDPAYAHRLAENLAKLVVGLAGEFTHVVAPATSSGKNFMPRAAAQLDVAQISDISAVESSDTYVRTIYAGNAL